MSVTHFNKCITRHFIFAINFYGAVFVGIIVWNELNGTFPIKKGNSRSNNLMCKRERYTQRVRERERAKAKHANSTYASRINGIPPYTAQVLAYLTLTDTIVQFAISIIVAFLNNLFFLAHSYVNISAQFQFHCHFW